MADFTVAPIYTDEEQQQADDYVAKVAEQAHKSGKAVLLLDPKNKLTILIIETGARFFTDDLWEVGAPLIVAFKQQCRIVVEKKAEPKPTRKSRRQTTATGRKSRDTSPKRK